MAWSLRQMMTGRHFAFNPPISFALLTYNWPWQLCRVNLESYWLRSKESYSACLLQV